ncbi:MAG TPA: LLM class F420-dependent oxidoreductase [Pseudonocardiaceae bacterium]|nr:LLM class F420-dependent oxidoreductase [Pseudonocardiaceae bacterium]
MKLGLHISDFTWPGGAPELRTKLAAVARTAEDVGFDRISVMDHFFQIPVHGPADHEMLEAYTTLGYLAAHTERVKLYTLVAGVIYRNPSILVKAVSTLDVLSGGRAMLGIGAGWNEEESRGLGIPFPPLKERFEQLEDALVIAKRMFSDDDSALSTTHFQLERPMNVPQPLSRPHPPILIGGAGEKKTLRFVAKYADSCNLLAFGTDLEHKLDVLREHCEREGRDFDTIEKTAATVFDMGPNGEKVGELVDTLGRLAELGFTVATGKLVGAGEISPIERFGKEVIPAVAGL